jgi:Novel STAND NTPase 1
VRRKADETMHGATTEELAALREAFVPGLVRANEEGAYVRRAAQRAALPDAALPVVEKLVAARLLVEKEDGSNIEVAHEALFRVWPTLASWLQEERDFLIGKSRIERLHEDYLGLQETEREKGFLSGILLERARRWLDRYPLRFTVQEAGYIGASARRADEEAAAHEAERERVRAAEIARASAEAQRAREHVRGARRLLTAAVVAAIALAGVGAWALVKRSEALEATAKALDERNKALLEQSRYLAGTSQALLNQGDAQRAMALAIDALPSEALPADRPYLPEAEAALRAALRDFQGQEFRSYSTLTLQKKIDAAVLSPTGELFATVSGPSVQLWDTRTGAEVARIPDDRGEVWGLHFSAGGDSVIVSSNSELRVWRIEEKESLVDIPVGDGAVICGWSYDPNNNTQHGVNIFTQKPEETRPFTLTAFNSEDKSYLTSWSRSCPVVGSWFAALRQFLATPATESLKLMDMRTYPPSYMAFATLDQMGQLGLLGWAGQNGGGLGGKFELVSLSPYGRQAIAAASDGTIGLWDVRNRARKVGQIHQFQHRWPAVVDFGRQCRTGLAARDRNGACTAADRRPGATGRAVYLSGIGIRLSDRCSDRQQECDGRPRHRGPI